MGESLYGDGGLYTSAGAPARHFRTSAHASPLWPQAVAELADRVDAALGRPGTFTVVDVGAGDGALLAGLADAASARWSLLGVDVAPQPPLLPDRVGWATSMPSDVTGLVVANEYLDVVALDVVELTATGPRVVLVSATGAESLGGQPSTEDLAWITAWWPLREIGDRAEVGRPRDEAWKALTARLTRGVAVAVDYPADPARDVAGTLSGFRAGRQTAPVPDGTCDLTAHVCFESLRVDGDLVLSQRAALRALGLSGEAPTHDHDPAAYLARLAAAGEAAELLDPAGLGGFTWLVHPSALSADLSRINLFEPRKG
jgi:SAM-dependent MidA family methyltransferase